MAVDLLAGPKGIQVVLDQRLRVHLVFGVRIFIFNLHVGDRATAVVHPAEGDIEESKCEVRNMPGEDRQHHREADGDTNLAVPVGVHVAELAIENRQAKEIAVINRQVHVNQENKQTDVDK